RMATASLATSLTSVVAMATPGGSNAESAERLLAKLSLETPEQPDSSTAAPPVAKDADSVPTDADSVPTDADSVPTDADLVPTDAAVPLDLYLESDESGRALTLQSKAALLMALYPEPRPCRVHLTGGSADEAEEKLAGEVVLVHGGARNPGTELPALACPAVLYAGLPSVVRALAERGGAVCQALLGPHSVCLKACKERSRWTRLCELTCPGQLGTWALPGSDDAQPPACLADLELALERPRYKPRPFLEGKRPTLVDILIVCYLRDVARKANRPPLPLGHRTADLLARLSADPAFAAAAAVTDKFETEYRPAAGDAPRLTDKRAQVPGLCTESLRQLLDRLEPAVSLPWQPEAEASPLPPLPDWLAAEVPPERAARKRQQLASLAADVLPLARPGHVIVDFCSGSGYLGLLLAHLLPQCRIVLVENKLESLQFALDRLGQLGLPNVRIVQSNLCNFRAAFDIGVALHACGSASDLVLEACVRARASCVLSPCCHGATKPGPGLAYPRSSAASAAGLASLEHAQLCHAADRITGRQSRQLLAKRALRLLDSDRALAMREAGYARVRLALMRPDTCSPKNSILVACPS
ncbi:hypothetical protein BOX15_Mlig014321g1, partial [Macrostomum lignano]